MANVKFLGQIDNNIVDSWKKRFEKRDGLYFCKDCGTQIMQVTCYVSIHDKLFEPTCAGSGQVHRINYPFCPKCDGDLEYATACYHV